VLLQSKKTKPGLHPPWRCGAFERKKPEERAKIIKDNKLCSFCLLMGPKCVTPKSTKQSLHVMFQNAGATHPVAAQVVEGHSEA
jgi:hypothetical protein